MFSELVTALAGIGYVTIKGNNVELSVDGRLVVLEEFYDKVFSITEMHDFEIEPVITELEGDSFKITNNDNEFILNIIYC